MNYKWLLILLIMYSCVRDKSNDSVTPIDVLTLKDTTAPASVLQFDTLDIKPIIEQTKGTSEADLSYKWSIHQNDAANDYPVIVLDSTRNLHQSISVKPGIYRLIYTVTVKSSGVSYFKFFALNVINRFSEGWLVLEDKAGKGDMSIILQTDTTFHHIFSDLNKDVDLSNPVQVAVSNSYGDKRIYIFTKNNGYELEYTEMIKVSDYTSWFWEVPAVFTPQLYMRTSNSSSFIINHGLFNARVEGGFPGDVKYMNTLPFPNDKGDDYNLAPFAVAGPQPYTGGKSPYTAILFDSKSKGFVYLSGASLIASLAPFGAPTGTSLFDMRDIGMDMVYMDEGYATFIDNAIFKNAAGAYYLYQFNANSSDPPILLKEITGDAPELAGSTFIASAKLLQQIYFVNNNNVYLYDIPSGKARVISTIPSGEQVSYIQCTTGSLYIATWNGTEGKVYRHTISPLGDFSATKSFTGFGKVVSMVYKVP
jgi:hypothetical protein